MKISSFFGNFIFFLLLFAVIIFCFFSLRPLVVLSGSMQPSIMIGDLIIIQKAQQYFTGETITFNDSGNRKITHRITKVEKETTGTVFLTKGDANRATDVGKVENKKILGKVVLVIPKIGYLINAIQNPKVFLPIIVFCAAVIVFLELIAIFKALRKNG